MKILYNKVFLRNLNFSVPLEMPICITQIEIAVMTSVAIMILPRVPNLRSNPEINIQIPKFVPNEVFHKK